MIHRIWIHCVIPIAQAPLKNAILVGSFINNSPFSGKIESLRQALGTLSVRIVSQEQNSAGQLCL